MIKQKFVILFVVVLFASVLPQSCTFDSLPSEDVSVCFETEILPLFISNCSGQGCHNSIDKEDGYDLTTYEGIMTGIKAFDVNGSKLMESILDTDPDKIMPPPPASPLTSAQIAKISEWINEGAAKTAGCQAVACDSISNMSFATDIFPIVQTNCAGGGCHDAGTSAGGYNLTNYSGVKNSVDNVRMLGTIKHQSGFSVMPPSSQLTDCDIQRIETWITEGALDN